MLMSHNLLDQEVEFFISFLKSAINGDVKYLKLIKPLLSDAKLLATGKSVYEIDNSALNLKILIDSYAHNWLLYTDVDNISKKALEELQVIINENKSCAIA